MNRAQRHRGPDDDGEEIRPFGSGWLGLGHRRLSILELSPLGHQPMIDPTSGNTIVFNGEIYNYLRLRTELEREGIRFRGGSDTEVLLQVLTRWGTKAIIRLEGMFAFAFHDVSSQRVILARDSVGIKPLYTVRAGSAFMFGSEVRSLLASGLVNPQVDRRGLAGLLAYGAVQHPFTLFEGIASLPPGSHQEITFDAAGRLAIGQPQRFWQFPLLRADLEKVSAVQTVRETVRAAVRDHLMADVPVGVFLSAGLDSTVIAGVAAEFSPRIQGYTVGFSDQPGFSETALAAETASRFGMEHVPINVHSAEAETAAIDWLNALDQPSVDGLNVFVISRAVRRAGIKVALSGLGSDELFGGYPSFRDVPRLLRLRRRLSWLPARARRVLAGAVAAQRPRAVRRKLSDMMDGAPSIQALYFHRRRVMSDRELTRLGLSPGSLGLTEDVQAKVAFDGLPEGADVIQAVSSLESRFYQGNMLLRDADANGMSQGLEIRVPFLDQRLLDAVHTMSGNVRLPVGAPAKYLLREAFPDLIRPELLIRPKTGFTLPIRNWMLGPLRGLCENSLRACVDLAGLPEAPVRAIWDEFLAEPNGPQWTRTLSLCVAGHYLSQHLSPRNS